MTKLIRVTIKMILLVPLYCIGWVMFGLLYLSGWLVDFIEEEAEE